MDKAQIVIFYFFFTKITILHKIKIKSENRKIKANSKLLIKCINIYITDDFRRPEIQCMDCFCDTFIIDNILQLFALYMFHK